MRKRERGVARMFESHRRRGVICELLTGEGGMREAQQWEVPRGMPGRCQQSLGGF